MAKVFVYGTLRAVGALHAHMQGAGFIGEATVSGFAMFDQGFYPAVEPSRDGSVVCGEVYAVDADHLARLDRVEGVPRLYRRAVVEAVLGQDDGAPPVTVMVFIYYMPEGQARRWANERILSGDWMAHTAGRVAS